MPLTLKKLEGHIAFETFACSFVHLFDTFPKESGLKIK